MSITLVRNIIALFFGIIGCLIALAVWHLYVDHVTFHNLLNAIAAQQQQANEKKTTP